MESGSRRSFFKGFRSGVTSSGLMFGIYGLVHGLIGLPAVAAANFALPALSAAFLPLGFGAVPMLLAIGLFGGVMAVRKEREEAKTARNVSREIVRDVQVTAASRGVHPMIEAGAVAEQAPAETAQGRWAARTGRSSDRIQGILANGPAGEQDRASAILREREEAQANLAR